MVGPIDSEERSETVLRIKVAFVLIVGASGGLVSLQGDASLPIIGIATLLGLVAGAVMVWLVFPGTGEVTSDRDRGPRR